MNIQDLLGGGEDEMENEMNFCWITACVEGVKKIIQT
jgi:hypothetical protein